MKYVPTEFGWMPLEDYRNVMLTQAALKVKTGIRFFRICWCAAICFTLGAGGFIGCSIPMLQNGAVITPCCFAVCAILCALAAFRNVQMAYAFRNYWMLKRQELVDEVMRVTKEAK